MGEVVEFPIKQQPTQPEPSEAVVHAPKRKVKTKTKQRRKDVVIPNAFGHLMVGTAIGLALTNHPAEMALVLFGSLLPDIDHPRSTLGQWNPLTRFMKHRGKCHTLVGSVLLSVPFSLFGGWIPFALVLSGAVGHILSDRLVSMLPGRQRFRIKIW
jgi:membrane-bound metal-dependent hydrolase YbcI (DUF457 family)